MQTLTLTLIFKVLYVFTLVIIFVVIVVIYKTFLNNITAYPTCELSQR